MTVELYQRLRLVYPEDYVIVPELERDPDWHMIADSTHGSMWVKLLNEERISPSTLEAAFGQVTKEPDKVE